MNTSIPPFHLAFPVDNLEKAEKFYMNLLGCKKGRSSDHWIDFDFYGHQIVAHLSEIEDEAATNAVDGHQVPVRHFGVILEWEDWESLAKRLQDAKIQFVIEPYVRFKGEKGEQATMFFLDPSGNALEFKAFKNKEQIFAHD